MKYVLNAKIPSGGNLHIELNTDTAKQEWSMDKHKNEGEGDILIKGI
jgi:hypothetical protein